MTRLFLRISIFSIVLSLMLTSDIFAPEKVHAGVGVDPNAVRSGARSLGKNFVRRSRRTIMQEARNNMPDINSFNEYHNQLRELQQKTTREDAKKKHRRRVDRLQRKPGIRYKHTTGGTSSAEDESSDEKVAPAAVKSRRGIRRVYPTIQRSDNANDRCKRLRGTRRSRCYFQQQNGTSLES